MRRFELPGRSRASCDQKPVSIREDNDLSRPLPTPQIEKQSFRSDAQPKLARSVCFMHNRWGPTLHRFESVWVCSTMSPRSEL